MIWGRAVVTRHLDGVGSGGRDDFDAVVLMVGWSDGRHEVDLGGSIGMRRGRSGKVGRIRWCGMGAGLELCNMLVIRFVVGR